MEAAVSPTATRSHELLADALRRLVRNGRRADITRLLSHVRPGDMPALLSGLTPAERLLVFQVVTEDYPDTAGDVLSDLEAPQRLELLEQLSPNAIAAILDSAAVDDAVYVLDSLPDSLRERVLELVDPEQLSEMRPHLTYEDETAGRIMDSELFALPGPTRVRQAIAAIQEQRDVEMIYYLYIVDSDKHLLGVTSLRQLLLSRPDQRLDEIMQTDVIRVHTGTDQEEVAGIASRHDLLAVPVVDSEDRLVGIVTVDDIVDVFKEEANEDILRIAGTSEDELLHAERSWRVAGIRLPWLLVNLVGGVITGMLLERFQLNFKEALYLLAFVPVVMGMGGNSGTQTSTITVRGLAMGRLDIRLDSIAHYLWQQLKVGVILGVSTGMVAGLAALVLHHSPVYSVVVGSAMLCAIVVASMNGVMIPLLFQRLGVDPAVAAGPQVTTSNDITGILIYFGLASLLIHSLVR